MNYRAIASRTNETRETIRDTFEPVLEAMEGIGYKFDEIPESFIELWKHGSTPANYSSHLQQLGAEHLLREKGIDRRIISSVINGSIIYDQWALFENACRYYIGEKLSENFNLVVDMINLYCEPMIQSDKDRTKAYEKAAAILDRSLPIIQKIKKELEDIAPYHRAGTIYDTVYLSLGKIEFIISHR
ncbi:hypothetical protein [Sulfurospirillum sp. 1612]|uniref:hypothetical protein n=1 Tax=Sulfurospirillum sp. 1612 TaxID=3094835 RepID=UPI002F923925